MPLPASVGQANTWCMQWSVDLAQAIPLDFDLHAFDYDLQTQRARELDELQHQADLPRFRPDRSRG